MNAAEKAWRQRGYHAALGGRPMPEGVPAKYRVALHDGRRAGERQAAARRALEGKQP